MPSLARGVSIRDAFPYPLPQPQHTWIRLADGTRLAACIWRPAVDQPLPAILEFLPYRLSDGTVWRDALRHPYLAAHGYASVRVDMRGSGNSDGLLLDEYLPQEQADALEVIAWLAAQPWCDGRVGMFGKSWGGFNALQVAALRPAALKAIITIASTDDRYADDVHYMGGCLLASEMLPWASTMLAYSAAPPDPAIVGERWRTMWRERLEKTPPFVEAWVAHQRRDAYWRHGSVCEDYGAIQCAVYAVGGSADGYTNAVPRLLNGLSCPRKGLIGPWAHNFPENAQPGPAIGFLQESVRWWDHWLKGIDNGIMDEPMVHAWIGDSQPPSVRTPRPLGRWIALDRWPTANAALRRPLHAPPAADGQHRLRGSHRTGSDGERWLRYGFDGDFAPDQRAEDGRSLCFEFEGTPGVDLLGRPQVTLRLAVDQQDALIAVRLCAVAPDGPSALVSWGLLNLTHRHGHAHPRMIVPDEPFEVTILLNCIGYRLAPGHRWRVALSPTYWPHAWPSPMAVTLSVDAGFGCRLALPVVDERDTRPPVRFARAEVAPPQDPFVHEFGSVRRFAEHDLKTDVVTLSHREDSGLLEHEDGLIVFESAEDIWTIAGGDPLSATVRCRRTRRYERDLWSVAVETVSTMQADRTHFILQNRVYAGELGRDPFEFTREHRIPRDHN